jgi:hypothetical protein
LTGGGEKFVYLCFEGSKVVLEGGGSLFAAVQFLESLEVHVRWEQLPLFRIFHTLAKSASCNSGSVLPFCLGGMMVVVAM